MSTELAGASPETVKNVEEIDWASWQARDLATLVFVIKDGKILLIRKKRGLGKGKINGPGGKVDPGENAVECAARECQEELGINVSNLECMGEHKFQFIDGYSIHCWVFRTGDMEGKAIETDEAIPLWTELENIPYGEMWEDDKIWLPMVIAGTPFTACWIFDDDRMLDYSLEMVNEVEPGGRKPLKESKDD
jgi:8-oxo-dGTP diphosphatase